MVNIKVAVRIRPLSQRELLQGEEVIVRKENKSVLVTNPKIPERQDGDSRQRTRRFAVDFCYDSKDPEGCSQEAVYKEIGSEVLHSMFEGYNACVLAYGHSASGKTYTIMGLQDDPGLTPRLCQGLFEKLRGRSADGRVQIQVVISFLEIYNEKVRDLLGNEEPGATSGNFSLRVREHPKLGPYVQGLSEHSVTEKRKLLELLTAGNRKRVTAATENNLHSSRSHAVFTIQFRQSDGKNYETEKSSKVHFVDLAGSLPQFPRQENPASERASSSQSKARLKEGANINKSLVTLGNVISALAESYDSSILLKEHSTSKSWQPFVPYRDSVLTWLLKDTLGGNSNTIMIATVSPASGCLSETVNTLRYAKRTKRIVNQPIVNEDPKIRTIRELRKEISRLRGLLLAFQSGSDSLGSWCRFDDLDSFPSPECKWQESEGTQITVKEDDRGWERGGEKNENEEGLESAAATSEFERGVCGGQKAAPSEGDACKIAHEKKSDVNVSVNDSFSHEAQTFSDSLESFSSVFLKTGCSCDADDDDDECSGELEAPVLRSCSYENLSMLHRSRPDLIKGISTRSKDALPSGSSRSCTDVSNLSQSTSENSLNSSGSPEAQPPESGARRPGAEAGKEAAGRRGGKNEAAQIALKKKEIVERVTDRLYATKKKPEEREKAVSKAEKDEEDDGELEELKLCKRARMKLFDLSRKLAMTRKFKKTVDSNTQTESLTSTIRMKEKCVTTDQSEAIEMPEETSKKEKKPCVIMNQVFIPRTSNCVVKCGRVVRIEPPEDTDRQETATQTATEDKQYKNANTSPIELSPREEDCFSEDSLDMDEQKGRTGREIFPEDQTSVGNPAPGTRTGFRWPPDDEPRFVGDSARFFTRNKESEEALFIGLPLSVFRKERLSGGEIGLVVSNSSLESRKEENLSSENSFTSVEGMEMNSSSETSSEDFVFYEGPKDKDLPGRPKATSDRELYTITENSEQSDPSDALSPVQSQSSSLNIAEDAKTPPRDEKREVLSSFSHVLDSKVPKCGSTTTTEVASGNQKRFYEEFAPGHGSERKSEGVRDAEVKRVNWANFQSNTQRQFLNLNISTGGKTTPFSVDTHLFKRVPTRDQSTDTMFTSSDSITFVFMGPAKPRTSVLMEIIRRSLGKSETVQKKSRSRGVQCDTNLVRSVSVDTAMFALSRIAKNQDRSPDMQRTASLGAVAPEEMVAILGQGRLRGRRETSCQCDFESDVKDDRKKSAMKCSVGTSTAPEDVPKKIEPKKSVSWSGDADAEWSEDEPEFGLSYGDSPEAEVEESNLMGNPVRFRPETPERRVRFLKPETRNHSEVGAPTNPPPFTEFLKEATQLLKSLNSRSSKVSDETKELEETKKREEKRRGGLKKTKREAMTRSRTESNLERNSAWRSKGAPGGDGADENLTWPRRRPPAGKPPTGMKPRISRSPLPFRSDSLHSNVFPDPPRNLSQSSRLGSSGQSWNLSSPSVDFGLPPKHSCSRWFCGEGAASPRSDVPKLNFDSIAELETTLEESCRRLELAAEQDKIREEILENKKGMFEGRTETRPRIESVVSSDELRAKEVLKRRQTDECSGGCTCRGSGSDSCKYLWSKLCRSSFELNSFGPGSRHCNQFCIFCRRKDAESYSSAVSLNSECSLGLCRLNYYGFCPCSPVRLQHVASSPRAYMQSLLALRRQIVSETKQRRPDWGEARRRTGTVSTSPEF